MSKGSMQRPTDMSRYRDAYDRIFCKGKRDGSKETKSEKRLR